MKWKQDNRGQPLGIARYFIVLAFVILLYIIVEKPHSMILSTARNQTTNQTALQAYTYQEQLFNWLPLLFVLIGGFGLVALAVAQQRGVFQ